MTRARRHRPHLRAALLPALLGVALSASGAAATGAGGATWTPTVATTTVTLAGFRVMRDSVYVFVHLTWDRAGVRALRRYEEEGLRYTQEIHDDSGRLSASGSWISDLPGASFDRDDDDGDGRWEEMEVTVTEPDAIEPGRTYIVGFQLTRWSRACESDDCRWRWTYRGGQLAALSQLSRDFFGEWQAERWTNRWAVEPYRRMGRPGR